MGRVTPVAGTGSEKRFNNKLLQIPYYKQQFPISATETVLYGCFSVNLTECSVQYFSALGI